MGKGESFQFKQFTINQQQTAMKVGTDGVLLGAWTSVDGVRQVLDIGTGTGLIALMLAQRTDAPIDAVEIEPNAFEQALLNVHQSPWSNQVNLFHHDFQNHANGGHQYDLVVCNPPFFVNSLPAATHERHTARHTDSLTFEELLDGVVDVLTSKGRFSLILPADAKEHFLALALKRGLFLKQLTVVIPRKGKAANRVLMTLCFHDGEVEKEEVILRNEAGEVTDEYRLLTGDYYMRL